MHPVEAPTHVKHTWAHKLGIILFVIVCFEVGSSCSFFPGRSNGRKLDCRPAALAARLLDSSYFRGALSGLGCSIFIFRLPNCCAFAGPAPPPA